MKLYSALVSTSLFYLSHATDEATYNLDESPLDIDSLGNDEPMNVILMPKPGVDSSATAVLPMSLKVTTTIEGFGIVAGSMTKKQYEDISNDEYSPWSIEEDGYVGALEGSSNLRRNLAESTPYGIPMVLQDMNFWNNLGAPSGSIKVCVADTGYDPAHEDLPKGGDVTGRDNPDYPGSSWDVDGHGHGTHCSGTVAALGGNNEGVVGVIPDNAGGKFQLMIGKALSDSGGGSWSGVMKAVELCVNDGAKVVSLSLGGSGYSSSMNTFFKTLYEEQDVLFVAAAGNGGNSGYLYPASYGALMSVAALDSNQNRASFSQFNDQVEISAPGVSVESTLPNDRYAAWSGTSMATPHVAGVAGLLWMHFPQCKNYQIRNVLLATAKDRGSSGCDNYYGTGLVQAKDAYDLLSEGNCGGHLGYTDASQGGCAQLNPSAPSFAPVTSPTTFTSTFVPTSTPTNTASEDKTFSPTTTETIVFPPTSTEEPIEDSFAPTASESLVVFPPTSTEEPIEDTFAPTFLDIPPTQYPTERPPTAYPTETPPTPHPTNTPPTLHPTVTPPTPHPTNVPPTPHPTEAPPTPYPTGAPPTPFPTSGAESDQGATESPTEGPTNAPTVGAPTCKGFGETVPNRKECCSNRWRKKTKMCK